MPSLLRPSVVLLAVALACDTKPRQQVARAPAPAASSARADTARRDSASGEPTSTAWWPDTSRKRAGGNRKHGDTTHVAAGAGAGAPGGQAEGRPPGRANPR